MENGPCLQVFARTNNFLNRLTEGGRDVLDLPLCSPHQPNNNLTYAFSKSIVRPVQFGPAEPFFPPLSCIYRGDEQSQRSTLLWPRGKKQWNMTPITNKPIDRKSTRLNSSH